VLNIVDYIYFKKYNQRIEMYASDLTQRKRAAAIYRDLQLQKEWFTSGNSIRILGQKGGNDYSYMMDLEQGCNQDKCWKYAMSIPIKSGNGPIQFDPLTMNAFDITTPFEYGDREFVNDTSLSASTITLDDGNIPVPMNGNDFYMFGYNAGAAGTIQWNSNNVLFFDIPTTLSGIGWESLVNYGASGGYRDSSVPAPGKGFIPVLGRYLLLGNYERRLRNFYTTQYTTLDNKYFISKFVVVFDDYFRYEQGAVQDIIQQRDSNGNVIPPPQGIFSVRLIRELSGQNSQWIEVSVIKSPPTPGYCVGGIYPGAQVNVYTARDSTGNIITSPHDRNPADENGNLIDPKKISPYDFCNGNTLINVCGTTFSKESPAEGSSFIFQSDSMGSIWQFKNNAYVPV
jgi:hypothetical protein